ELTLDNNRPHRSGSKGIARREQSANENSGHESLQRVAHGSHPLLIRFARPEWKKFRVDRERSDDSVAILRLSLTRAWTEPDFPLAELAVQFPAARGGEAEIPLT